MATMFSSKPSSFRALKRTLLTLCLFSALLILFGAVSNANAAPEDITIVNSTNETIYVATAKYMEKHCPVNNDPSQSTVGCVATASMVFNGWWDIEPGKSRDFLSQNRIYVKSAGGSRILWPNVNEFDGLVWNGHIFNDVSIPFGYPGNPDNTLYNQELTRRVNPPSTYTRVKYQILSPGTYNTNTATQSAASTQSTAASYNSIHFKNNCSTTIYTAIVYRDLNDTWVTDGWWELSPGEDNFVAKTKYGIYYIYAQSSDEKTTWSGNDYFTKVHDSSTTYGFIKKEITTTQWGTWTQSFDPPCGPSSNTNNPPPANSSQTVVTQVNVLSAVERIDENSIAEAIAAAGDYVYWKDRGTNFLIRGQVINGRLTAAQTIDSNSTAELLAAAGDYVYWKDRGTTILFRGKVIDGRLGAVERIDENSVAEALAASGDYVYWKDRGATILFRGKVIDGHLGAVERIDENSVAELLSAAGQYVFWKDRGTTILFRGQALTKTVTSASPTSVPSAGGTPPSANTNAPSSNTNTTSSSNTNTTSSGSTAPSAGTSASPAGAATCPIDLCVTNITVSPNPPKRKQEINFTATFVNNSGGERSFNWVILLYDPNKSGPNKGFGESIMRYTAVPAGVSTATATYTGVMGAGGCVPLYAQAAYYQGDSTKPTISGSDGQPFTVNFDVCP